MKKIISLLFLSFSLSIYCFSQTVNDVYAAIEITNVVFNGGRVYLTIFSTAENFKNGTPDFEFILEPDNNIITKEISLKEGEYLIAAFQDANNNGILDYGLFGIPKELSGMSNYFGRGYPSKNFDKQKILINNMAGKITIGLHRF